MAKIIINKELRSILKENNISSYDRYKIYYRILESNEFDIDLIRKFENQIIENYKQDKKSLKMIIVKLLSERKDPNTKIKN